ncbi:MAG: aldo/keto reductase [Bacillota bacterium]|nr:aldo/keto reductase [Bacillota bacterium]
MRTIKLGKSSLNVPVIAVGCMRLNSIDKNKAEAFIKTAIDNGANFFDHADIYGKGECEKIFSECIHMNSDIREKIIIQSKCGIVPGKMYDFSKEHILSSVDGILSRLKTDYLDVLLLHRPDALVEPEEVGEAFELLKETGKVRYFGVSNHNPMQIQLLMKSLNMSIEVNQLQLSIANSTMISNGINVNMMNDAAVCRDGSVLDFCRLNNITIQTWSPFQYGFFNGTFVDNDEFGELNKKLSEIANKYNASKTTIVMAWLLRHSASFQPVTGTMNTERLLDCIKAAEIKITREEWYDIFKSCKNKLP